MGGKYSAWLDTPVGRFLHGFRRFGFGINWAIFNHPLAQNTFLTILVALFYVAGIKASDQLVSTLVQGRITPIWFPSALTFGLFFHFSHRVIPGIILGSVFGLISILSTFDPRLDIPQFLLLEISFAFANTAQPFLGNFWLKEQLKVIANKLSFPLSSNPQQINDPLAAINPFKQLETTITFIKAAIFAPMVSATVGITALVVLKIVPLDNALYCWITWWLGSALAIIVFSPILIAVRFHRFSYSSSSSKNIKAITFTLATILIGYLTFYQSYPVGYLFLPLVLMIVFYFGGFIGSLTVALIAMASIFVTAKGYGAFVNTSPNNALIFLQAFTAVLSMTALLFAAVIQEKKNAQRSLQEVIQGLENKVQDRTQELSNAKTTLEITNDELEKLVNVDCLTNIPNRRCFEQRFEQEWQKFRQGEGNLSLMMIDVDYFKFYNDHYGHSQGDSCLIQVAQLLVSCLHRPNTDLVARYGGEEFVMLVPDVDSSGATIIAERILDGFRRRAIPHQAIGTKGIVTVSIGLAVANATFVGNKESLLDQADLALYQAKRFGRNQYKVFVSCDGNKSSTDFAS